MTGRRLLITGGLGNLGSWLTIFFSKTYDVYVLSKSVENKLNCKYTVIQVDITDIDALTLKLNFQFDYCIHVASYNEFFHDNYAKNALEINTLGTRNLIEVLKDTKIKNFIYLSTFHVYGMNSGVVTEETELNPKNDYASTHLFAEYYLKQFFRTHNFPFVIFRLSNSYGSPKYKNTTKWYLILNSLVKSAYEQGEIVIESNGKLTKDFIWMGDVCVVIEKSINFKSNINNIFNLSSNMTYSILDMAKKVQTIYKKRFSKDIDILIDTKDKSLFLELKVDNTKLTNRINIIFQDKSYEEINSIFDILETN